MKPTLTPYLDCSAPGEDEFERLISEIEAAILQTANQRSDEDIRDRLQNLLGPGAVVLSNEDIGAVLGRTAMTVGLYRRGERTPPDDLIRLLRVVHKRVQEDPVSGARAILDFIERKQKSREREIEKRREKYLTTMEATAVLDLSKQAIYGLLEDGVLRGTRGDNNEWLIRRDDVMKRKKARQKAQS